MRGKSVDVDFISEFVGECVQQGKASPKDIASEARIKISNIDDQIRQIESLKGQRSKLIDVVNSFDSNEETEVAESGTFATNACLSEPINNEIFSMVMELRSVSIGDIMKKFGEGNKNKIFLGIKQLAEAGLLARDEDKKFVPGPKTKGESLDADDSDDDEEEETGTNG
jgi:flagellar motor switch protein FliG